MTPPSPVRRSIARALVAGGLLLTAFSVRAAKPAWKPVSAEELAETTPRLEKEAPAEALFVNVEVDDTSFPFERTLIEHFRYKIFAPEKAEHITRISGIDSSASSGRVELRARLTLPDGRVQEFGQESIQERTLSKSGKEGGFLGWLAGPGLEVKEKFLAISGVEAGAVLDYQITRRVGTPPRASWFTGQREGIPVRQFTYVCRTLRGDDQWENRTFVRNTQSAKLTEDRKAGTITVTATNLPSVVREPFVGPATDYALTIFNCYELFRGTLIPRSGKIPLPGAIEAKLGPWVPHATISNWFERDRGYATKRVKELAATITLGLTEPEAKARAIHLFSQEQFQKSRVRSVPPGTQRVQPNSLDDVLEIEKMPEVIRVPEDFVWLSVALNRAAGVDCNVVMLPNRTLTRFTPQHVSPVFLAQTAVALKFGDEWRFSFPHSLYRQPFGILPWEHEGQVGLLALERKQDFIKVPASAAEKSVIATTGKFQVAADGTLTGECTRTFTGQAAVALRGELRKRSAVARTTLGAGKFGMDPKTVEIRVTKIDALNDAEQPLRLTAKIRWPGFATRTKDRLLLRPAVFRVDAGTPFTATERRHPISFPYRWQETDRIEITLPEGFEPEVPSAPPSSPGEVMHHETQLNYDRKNRVLHTARSFTSNILDLAPDRYPNLKAWYDRVARADQHEVVFSRKSAAAPATAPAAKGE